jgi:hypothetical protein
MIKHEKEEYGMKKGGKAYSRGGLSEAVRKGAELGGIGSVVKKKAGGLAAGHKSADGIARKGKTKGMEVKMMGGGKC